MDGGEYKTIDPNSLLTFEEAGVLDGSEIQVAPDALAFEDNVDTMRPLVASPPAGHSAGNDSEEVRPNTSSRCRSNQQQLSFERSLMFCLARRRREEWFGLRFGHWIRTCSWSQGQKNGPQRQQCLKLVEDYDSHDACCSGGRRSA